MKSSIILFILLLVSLISCNKNENTTNSKPNDDSSSHKLMVQELQALADDTTNLELWHLNAPRARMMELQASKSQQPGQKISLSFQASNQWLNAGNYDRSIEVLQALLNYISANSFKLGEDNISKIQELLGIAYLRKAEIENCIQNHTEYSCILPIQEEGQHVVKQGSENALKVFDDLLEKGFNEDVNKWLYNVTQMTLGNYPDNIPQDRLIDPSIFQSEYDFPRFPDKAMDLGVAVGDISGSVIMEDFNNDNYLDLMVSSYGLDDQLHYFENNGKNGFSDKTQEANLTGLYSGLNMVQADYNNDGNVDFLILRGAWLGADGNHPNSLVRNNGDGTFTDVTRDAGIYSKYPSQTASWLDVNSDGWIDVFIGNESSPSMDATCELYINQKDGTFKESAAEYGLNLNAFIKACNAGDYNNDGNPDLYVSNIYGENFLMKNMGKDGDYKFVNESVQTRTSKPTKSFSCWFFDYNQDGWDDIFVSGFDFSQFETAAGEVHKDMTGRKTTAELPKLYLNDKNGSFSDMTQQANVNKVLFTMGCNYGDLDNDGYPDFYAATGTPDFRALIPNRMFRNNRGEKFQDITTAGGFGHLQKGHGVAIGDVDMDGDQDVYTVLGGSYDGDSFMNALFVNPTSSNNWVKLKLVGKRVNRSAIGSKVEIIAKDDQGKQRSFYNTVNSGGSFGANTLIIEQGLAEFGTIVEVRVKWNNLLEERFQGVVTNGMFTLTQGEGKAIPVEVNGLDFNESKAHGHHHHNH